MAPTNMAATTTDPYGYNCFLTLWTTLAQLNNAQNLKHSLFQTQKTN
jgi:hypothetical protein